MFLYKPMFFFIFLYFYIGILIIVSMKTQQIQRNSQKSGIFSRADLDEIQQYEYKGRMYIVGSTDYIRHIAALKAHVTRLRQYVQKKETAHNASIKAYITRKANIVKKAKSASVDPMKNRKENDLIQTNLLLEWK